MRSRGGIRRMIMWLTGSVMGAACVGTIVLMVRHAGLIDGLDFGCGQYYYTDIPDWTTRLDFSGVRRAASRWVYAIAFAVWGVAMYLLWRWIDRHSR